MRQLIAQDKRTNENGLTLYHTANIFISNKAFLTAIKVYKYILTKGTANEIYTPAKMALIFRFQTTT